MFQLPKNYPKKSLSVYFFIKKNKNNKLIKDYLTLKLILKPHDQGPPYTAYKSVQISTLEKIKTKKII